MGTNGDGPEPTNKQLANFLMIQAESDPELAKLRLSEPVLEALMSQNPRFRAGALQRYKRTKDKVHSLAKDMAEGKLQCNHIGANNRRCTDNNMPGSAYCERHQREESGADAED